MQGDANFQMDYKNMSSMEHFILGDIGLFNTLRKGSSNTDA